MRDVQADSFEQIIEHTADYLDHYIYRGAASVGYTHCGLPSVAEWISD